MLDSRFTVEGQRFREAQSSKLPLYVEQQPIVWLPLVGYSFFCVACLVVGLKFSGWI